jgi:hemoglobin
MTSVFYQHVPADPLLGPLFAEMHSDHPYRVAHFLAEVLGGPAGYSREYAGPRHMHWQHLGRNLTTAHRRRWLALLLETADDVGLPADPEFRSALVGCLE